MADLKTLGDPPIHYRSLAFFFGYLSIATGLILSIIRVINVRYHARQKQNDWNGPQRRKQFYLFAILAALSLGFTWFHMISLFVWSYKNWASSPNGLLYSSIDMPTVTRMGLWLKNTYVFQEAWETVSENPTRFWWSGQIFGWTIGWSIFLGITGRFGTALEEMLRGEINSCRRYRIPHVWVYMLVAQAVSVSFAANLFFAAITVSQRPNEKHDIFAWSPSLVYELVPVVLSLLDTVAVPIFAYEKKFMLVLLAPHALVFIPCVLRPRSSASKGAATKVQGEQTTKRYASFLYWIAAASVVLQAYFTVLMLLDMGPDVPYGEVAQRLLDTVYVHPACSSVSWDVIWCTVSGFAWAVVHGFDSRGMLGGR
ncbi:uncharacterized protein N7459_002069 [Penicillium hispanicum]|uniref:uncharacterized protein n=1 Tax=Penicillium hispanicum TaxID=1080232 RepID=UPI0025410C87|nr:uncharacterized protein N7459_002069 [Penicillium hispanicum]KAJ5591700.1 hypothetical protein N7459_002069 [Penicillium hispanicum]